MVKLNALPIYHAYTREKIKLGIVVLYFLIFLPIVTKP